LASKIDLGQELVGYSKTEDFREARMQIEQFSKRFPFRIQPQAIQDLKPSDVYEKGSKDTFFYWVEYGTSAVASITIYGANIFENVKGNLDAFKDLLKNASDDRLGLHQKVDAPWDTFRGFGGDRHIAKKIIALLYPEHVLPIFSTKHFENFALKLRVDLNAMVREVFQKDYENATVGEKFESLNLALSRWRDKHASGVDNIALQQFLYEKFPPPSAETVQEQAGILGSTGLLFEPENELGVVSIFSMYHRELGFPFVVRIQNSFPDATVISDEGETVLIEFEYKASSFIQHGHSADGCDLVVCWENDLSQAIGPEILALKDKMKEIMKNRFVGEPMNRSKT
jgi:hypothetical protein